jgi:hypothetical protein
MARVLCKERIYTPERNAKISAARKGKSIPRSDEAKRKHKETLAAKKAAGIGLSDQHRQAIGKGLCGNTNGRHCVVTEEHKQRLSKLKSKEFKITDPDGNSFIVSGLSQWLQSMGCNTRRTGLYKRGVLKGYTIEHAA